LIDAQISRTEQQKLKEEQKQQELSAKASPTASDIHLQEEHILSLLQSMGSPKSTSQPQSPLTANKNEQQHSPKGQMASPGSNSNLLQVETPTKRDRM
jgi:hypothetical protein